RYKVPDVERRLRISAFFDFDEKGPDDGHDNAHARQHQWNKDRGEAIEIINKSGADKSRAEYHGAHDRADIALKKVSTHTSHVADVVTDVVCYCSGVQWMVFRNAGFHFSDEVT